MSETLTMTYTSMSLPAGHPRRPQGRSPGPRPRRSCADVFTRPDRSAFVATHLKDRAPAPNRAEILFEDPELGFCIAGPVYDGHGQRLAADAEAVARGSSKKDLARVIRTRPYLDGSQRRPVGQARGNMPATMPWRRDRGRPEAAGCRRQTH